ncbi:MAG: hypothetical protein OHK0012_04120 [Synechococcales cyanobacterium]
MAESTSSRRQKAEQQADALFEDLFEDLDSNLRTTPMLPRQWGSRFANADLYPAAPARRWGKWIIATGCAGLLLAGWGLWRSYSTLMTQVVTPDDYPTLEVAPEAQPVVVPPETPNAPTTTDTQAEKTDATTPTATTPAPDAKPKPEPVRPAVAPLRPAPAPIAARPPVVPAAMTDSMNADVIRYIAPPPSRTLVSPQVQTPQGVPSMKLVGTVSGPGTPMALILVDDVVREVPVGQAVLGSWRVQSVSRDGVTLSNGSRGFAMHMGLGQTQ